MARNVVQQNSKGASCADNARNKCLEKEGNLFLQSFALSRNKFSEILVEPGTNFTRPTFSKKSCGIMRIITKLCQDADNCIKNISQCYTDQNGTKDELNSSTVW